MRNDPFIESLLGPLEEKHQRTAPERARQREIEEQQKHRRLELYERLTAIKNCEPGVIIDRRTGEWISPECFHGVMAERLLRLVKFLKESNELGRLNRLPTDSPGPRFLRHILLDSVYCEGEIAELLRRIEPLEELASDLCIWLHGKLQEVIFPDQWPEADVPGSADPPSEGPTERSSAEQAVVGPDAGAGAEEEDLTDRQRLILETMLEQGITSERRRKSIPVVVKLVNRTFNPETCKRDFARLRARGYLGSRPGPGGGVWLTPTGTAAARASPS